MTVEDGEAKYHKRWHQWSPEETLEFVRNLEPSNLMNPLCLRLAFDHFDELSEPTKDEMVRLGYPREKKP